MLTTVKVYKTDIMYLNQRALSMLRASCILTKKQKTQADSKYLLIIFCVSLIDIALTGARCRF